MLRKLQDCPEFIAGDKTLLRVTIQPEPDVAVRYSLAWFKVLPGQRSIKHAMKTSEVYYILSGQGIMHIGKETFSVSKDDTVYIPPHAVQYLENPSKTEPIVALAIVDPAWRKEDEVVLE